MFEKAEEVLKKNGISYNEIIDATNVSISYIFGNNLILYDIETGETTDLSTFFGITI